MTVEQMQTELNTINSQLDRLYKAENGSYTAQMGRAFHLGMVGGSGRNNYRLNKRRKADLDRTIKRAHESVKLNERKNWLEKQIEYITSGQRERDIEKKKTRAEILAEWFRNLKPGDTFKPGGNVLTIAKVSKKSLMTTGNCKWTAYEVIGKEASALL